MDLPLSANQSRIAVAPPLRIRGPRGGAAPGPAFMWETCPRVWEAR